MIFIDKKIRIKANKAVYREVIICFYFYGFYLIVFKKDFYLDVYLILNSLILNSLIKLSFLIISIADFALLKS